MDEAQEAADSLKDRAQVILNLEAADEGMDRRILDFVSGACYALDGFYQRVGTKVFLFAPSNVYIEVEDQPTTNTVRPPSFLTQDR
jgi:cell division inhibitor SepF